MEGQQSILTTNEAGRLKDFFFLLFFTPQISKGVDDYTKDEVEDNDDDHEEEQQVVYHSGCEQGLLGKGQANRVTRRRGSYRGCVASVKGLSVSRRTDVEDGPIWPKGT